DPVRRPDPPAAYSRGSGAPPQGRDAADRARGIPDAAGRPAAPAAPLGCARPARSILSGSGPWPSGIFPEGRDDGNSFLVCRFFRSAVALISLPSRGDPVRHVDCWKCVAMPPPAALAAARKGPMIPESDGSRGAAAVPHAVLKVSRSDAVEALDQLAVEE